MNDKINDGGPAFPTMEPQEHSDKPYLHWGQSLRDKFAGDALAGDWAAQDGRETGVFANNMPNDGLVERAQLYYRMADAMIKARGQS